MICKKTFSIATLFLGLLNPFTAVKANELPQDLVQLWNEWQAVPKTELSSQYIQVDSMVVAQGEDTSWPFLTQELEGMQDKGPLVSLAYLTPEQEVREHILKSVIPSQPKQLSLCEAFSYEDFTPRNAAELNAEQLEEIKQTKRSSQCRKNIHKMFGGIFHANPKATMIMVENHSATGLARQVLVYIPSFINPSVFLRYKLKVY